MKLGQGYSILVVGIVLTIIVFQLWIPNVNENVMWPSQKVKLDLCARATDSNTMAHCFRTEAGHTLRHFSHDFDTNFVHTTQMKLAQFLAQPCVSVVQSAGGYEPWFTPHDKGTISCGCGFFWHVWSFSWERRRHSFTSLLLHVNTEVRAVTSQPTQEDN